MIKNNFKLILRNSEDKQFDIDYKLHDSLLAGKWFKKIKHLRHVPIDPVESEVIDVSDIQNIYKDFCKFANLEPITIKSLDQSTLNRLHKIYEEQHDALSRLNNNEILYKFHHSIHYSEDISKSKSKMPVGWGINEGPLTEQFDCYSYYDDEVRKNNMYLPWAELGKTPFQYYTDNEPDNQRRMLELCKPHTTFRAKFFIGLSDITPSEFPLGFLKWFDQYKEAWYKKYNLEEYSKKHEHSAPILAHTTSKQDLTGSKFVKLEL